MLRDVLPSTVRKARTFLLSDQNTLQVNDRPLYERYYEYPLYKRAIVRLPLPFRKHRKIIRDTREAKSLHDPDKYAVEFDEKDKKLASAPDGILGVHLLELHSISLRVTDFDRSAPVYYYCVLHLGNKRKMTKVTLGTTPERVRLDATHFFSFDISNVRDNHRNRLKIEIWACQDPQTHFLIGTKDIHIYTLIQKVNGIDVHHLWGEGLHAGTLVYEYSFAYGQYGFGHSNQLKNTESSVFESICRSMFPRIRLSESDLVDNKYNIRVPKQLQMIGLSNFLICSPDPNSKKRKEDDDTFEPKFFTLNHVEFDKGRQAIFAKINMQIHQEEFEADFNDIYGEYICLSSRQGRLDFLQKLVYGRLEDIRETEVGALFQELNAGIAEDIFKSEDTAQGFVYPKTIECTDFPMAYVEPDDEKIYEKMAIGSRTPGWLSRLFGYIPIETDIHYGEPEYPYKHIRGYTKHRTPILQVCWHGLKYFWGRFTHMLLLFIHFLLPDLRPDTDVPDIAVTLPSPVPSTTDLYVSWVNDERVQFEYAVAYSRSKEDPVEEAHEAVNGSVN